MKIRILYQENIKNGHAVYTTVEVPDDDYTIVIEEDYQKRLAETKPEKRDKVKRCNSLQEVFDIANKKEYNNWHRHNRHWGQPIVSDDFDGDMMDTFPDYSQEIERNQIYATEALCKKIRAALKPDYADIIIAIHIEKMSIQEYAQKIGIDANNASHRLKRAEKKLKKVF